MINILETIPLPAVILRLADCVILASNTPFQTLNQHVHLDTFWTQLAEYAQGINEFQAYELQASGVTETRWLLVAGKVTPFEDQAAVLLTFQDMTAQKQREAKVEERMQRYRILAEFISDYTYAYRVEPGNHFVQEWLTEMFTEVTGFTIGEVDPFTQTPEFVHPSDVDIALQQIQALISGEASAMEFRIVTKKGEICWLRNFVHPIWSEAEGRVIRFYGMAQDITYRKRAEEALLYGTAQDIAYRKQAEEKLRRYATELENINHELDAYSHTIAHDLKAPLSGVLGYLDLFEYAFTRNPEKAQLYISRVKDTTEQMVKMINQLLLMARLRNAQEKVERIEILPTIEAALMRFQGDLDKHQVQFEIMEPIPAALGHAPWVEEVFANLIGNAIKYMGDDNPTPRITVRGTDQGEEIRYTVEDNGVGIAVANQAKLFEMFTRLDTVKREGTGLGLSIVHRIVTKLNGKVGVESEPGKGSTFWFTLPH